ncbi:hypothetical protein BC629DRAFT_553987 [Irpex lacteus]|nr:hypothetical protein BC629DRAFT_553987 [Irpex lacteus]
MSSPFPSPYKYRQTEANGSRRASPANYPVYHVVPSTPPLSTRTSSPPSYLSLPTCHCQSEHQSLLPYLRGRSPTTITMSPHPRPILKRLFSSDKHDKQTNHHQQPLPFATCARIMSPRVHFPPTPSMVASTHPVHSPQTYDRKPIVISPNYCALPQRGSRKLYSPPADFEVERPERGRGRARQSSDKAEHIKGSYFHPRAYEACEPEPIPVDDSQLSPPLLVHDSYTADEYDSDVDSSDDESVTTPPDTKLPTSVSIVDPSASSRSQYGSSGDAKGIEDMGRPTLVRSNKRPSIQFTQSRENIFSPALEGF